MIGFALGVVASLLAWLIVAALLRPRLTWESDLRAISHSGAPWFYVYLRNRRPWQAFDVKVEARLRVRGLYEDHPERWATFDLPLDDPHIPVLRGTLTSQRANASRLRIIFTGGTRQGFRVLSHPSELPDRLRCELPESGRPCSLIDLLSLTEQSEIYFVATATDGFSGTRGVFISTRFCREHLESVITATDQPLLHTQEPSGISADLAPSTREVRGPD